MTEQFDPIRAGQEWVDSRKTEEELYTNIEYPEDTQKKIDIVQNTIINETLGDFDNSNGLISFKIPNEKDTLPECSDEYICQLKQEMLDADNDKFNNSKITEFIEKEEEKDSYYIPKDNESIIVDCFGSIRNMDIKDRITKIKDDLKNLYLHNRQEQKIIGFLDELEKLIFDGKE